MERAMTKIGILLIASLPLILNACESSMHSDMMHEDTMMEEKQMKGDTMMKKNMMDDKMTEKDKMM